jgi:hypothetical protein
MGTSVPTFDIKLDDVGRLERFQRALADYQLPLGLSDGDLLEEIGAATVRLARSAYWRPARQRGGWSPACAVATVNFRKVIDIRRHIFGYGRYGIWTAENYRDHLRRLLSDWRNKLRSLATDDDSLAHYLNAHENSFGFRYWEGLSYADIREVATTAMHVTQKRLHGRMRTEMRRQLNAATARIEEARAKGRVGPLLARVMGARRRGFRMEALTVGGDTLLDKFEVHAAVTSHFQEWYRRPLEDTFLADMPTMSSGQGRLEDFREDLEKFQMRYSHLGIPDDLLALLWKHL